MEDSLSSLFGFSKIHLDKAKATLIEMGMHFQ